jgi:hypothetical protein
VKLAKDGRELCEVEGCAAPRFSLLLTCPGHASKETWRILRAMVDPVYRRKLEERRRLETR